ncbi:MAG: LysR family transcriptional regulator [Faecousia sp.]
MDNTYLREFLVLAKLGNYHAASDELFISQSTLSKHIQILEKETECELFLRTAKGIVLTEAGRQLIPYANRIIQVEDQMLYTMTRKPAIGGENCISIASEYFWLSGFLSKFMRKYPQYTVNCQVGTRKSAKNALRDNCVELGFAKAYHANDSDLFSAPFGRERLCAIVSKEDPLALRPSLALQDLRDRKFLMPSKDVTHTGNLIRMCQQAGFMPDVAAFVSPEYNLFHMVQNHFGISVLYVDPGCLEVWKELAAIPVEPKSEVQGAICWRKDVELSPGAKLLRKFAVEEFPRVL